MSQLITREYQGLTFTFREDGYFYMTKAAKAFGKDMQVFSRRDDTVEYIDALAKTVPDTELVEAKAGRYGGTWIPMRNNAFPRRKVLAGNHSSSVNQASTSWSFAPPPRS